MVNSFYQGKNGSFKVGNTSTTAVEDWSSHATDIRTTTVYFSRSPFFSEETVAHLADISEITGEEDITKLVKMAIEYYINFLKKEHQEL